MANAQYENKFKEMQNYLPFLQKVIEELKVANAQEGDNPRKMRLQKIERLREFLANKPKQLKMETLMKFEGILIKLHDTYKLQQERGRQDQSHRQNQHHNRPERKLSSDKQNYKENVEKLEGGKNGCTSEILTPQDKNGYPHQDKSVESIHKTTENHNNTATDLNSPSFNSLSERKHYLSEDSYTPRQSPKKTIAPTSPQKLQTNKVVTTEPIPVHIKQHINSYQHSTRNYNLKESLCGNNLKNLPPEPSREDKVDHGPELLWDEYNKRSTNKSTEAASLQLRKQVSETTSVSEANFAPISISEHCTSIQGVSKTPLPTNHISKPFLNSGGYELSNNISKKRTKRQQTPIQSGKDDDIIIISSDEELTLEPRRTKKIYTNQDYNDKHDTDDKDKYDKDLVEKSSKKYTETTFSNAKIHEIPTKDTKHLKDNKPTAEPIVKNQNFTDSFKETEHHYENQVESSYSSTFFTNFTKEPDDKATISSYTLSSTFKKEPEDTKLNSMANISTNSTLEANIDIPNNVEQQIVNVDRHHILRLLGKFLTEDHLEITKTKKECIWQTEEPEKEAIKEQITKKQTSGVKKEYNEDEEKHHIASSSKLMRGKIQTAIPVVKIKQKEVDRSSIIKVHSNETNIENSPDHIKRTETTIRRMEAKIDATKPLRVTIKIYAANADGEKDETDTGESIGDYNSSPDSNNAATSQERKLMVEKYYTPSNFLEEKNPFIQSKINPKSKNSQENNKYSEDNSEIQMKNGSTQYEVENVENSMETKNTNKNWHNQSKYAKLCLLCRKKLPPKTSTNHYKMHHGENYISRLAPNLLQKFKLCQLRKPIFGVDKTPKQPSWFHRCPFCLEYLNKPMTAWVKHFQNHTAEFRYKCSQCHKCNNRAYVIRRHIKEHCKGATMVHSHVKQTSSTMIKAHVCHLCNFIQLKRTNLDRHYVVQHQFETQNLDLLGYTLTLFDAKNVEMVEEDEEILAWNSIKSEERVKDITEETNELGVQDLLTERKSTKEVKNEAKNKSTTDMNVENPSLKRDEKLTYKKSPLNRAANRENPDAYPQTKVSQNCEAYNEDLKNYSKTESENEFLRSELDQKSIKIKNININWHSQSKYTKLCVICKKKLPGKCSAFHYNMHHGENYISRLAPDVLQQFKKGKFSKPLFGVEKKPPNRPSWFYRCPFCLKYFNTSIPVWLQHFKDHTAEFLFECSRCHRGNNRKDIILRHIKEQCKEATVVRSDVNRSVHTLINAHVCHLCNFMQLKRSNLDRHYLEQHQFEKGNVVLFGYIITLFDAKNIEMLPEDKAKEKENDVWKYIKSKEQVRDMREIDEQVNQDITTDKETIKTSKDSNNVAVDENDITANMQEALIDKKLDKTILNPNKYDDYETVQDIQDNKQLLLLEFSNSIALKDISQDGSLNPQMEVVETTQIPEKSIVPNKAAGGQFRVTGPDNLNSIEGVFDSSTYLTSSLLPSSSTLQNKSDNSKDRTSSLVFEVNYEDISNSNQNPQTFTSNTTGFNANPDDESRSNPTQDENERGKILELSGNADDNEEAELQVTSSNYLLDYEFSCFHCDFKTQIFNDLKTHYQNIHNFEFETAKPFWYFLYLKSQCFSQDVPNYNNHLKSILMLGDSQTSYQCTLCSDIFPNSVAVVQHACNIHAGEESFSFSQLNNTLIYHCAVCYFTSINEMDLLRHMIDHYCEFQKCNFCRSLQSSFVGYMQHCYAEHKNDIHRFRELYPLSQITKYLLNMFIVFPNGLILKKHHLLNTEYGKTQVIEKLYEEMWKMSQQPPIPRLSIANLVAQHKINSLSLHHVLESETKLLESSRAKKILKRRYTVDQEDNVFCERKSELTNEALQKTKKITQRRKTVTIKLEEQQNEFNALPLLEPEKISQRRRTLAIDQATFSPDSTLAFSLSTKRS